MNIRPHKNKTIRMAMPIILSLLFVISVVGYFILSNQYKPQKPIDSQKTDEMITKSDNLKSNIDSNKISMSAMGDMLAHDTIIANAKNGNEYDFTKFFVNIKSSYADSDLVFCNQEGLSAGEAYGISGYPSFNAPIQFASGLQTGAGCNIINLANNHMGDKGVGATNATIDVWQKLGPVAMSGANKTLDEQKEISVKEINGIKICFLAFADFNNNASTPGYSVNNYHDESLLRSLVTNARKAADVVIVSMHWGVEDSNNISQDQITHANLLSSLGVDIIIGTGPHVLQEARVINRQDGGTTTVWYSLGNMLSSQLNIKQLIGGIARFDITKQDDGKILVNNLNFTPTYMHYEWSESEAASGNLLARKNAMIYILKDSESYLSRSLFKTTVSEQMDYVSETIGDLVTIK